MTPFMYVQFVLCPGCPKQPEWSAGAGWICPLYRDASKLIAARHGKRCFHNPDTNITAAAAKKLNPLKASRRARKGM